MIPKKLKMIQRNPEVKKAKKSLEYETAQFTVEIGRLSRCGVNEPPYNSSSYREAVIREYQIVYGRGKRLVEEHGRSLKREASDFLKAASDFERQFRKFEPDFVL